MKALHECSREELQARLEKNTEYLRQLTHQITGLEDTARTVSFEQDAIRARLNQIAIEQRAVLAVVV